MKTRRIVQGLILLAAGIVFCTIGILIVFAAQDQTRLAEQSFQRAEDSCREAANTLVRSVGGQGHLKELKDGESWEILLRTVNDKRMALADSTAVIAACPTRSLEYYCLGPACGPQEARFIRPGRQNSVMVMRLALRPEVPLERAAKLNAPAAPTQTPPSATAPSSQPQPGRPPTPQLVRPPAQPGRPLLPQQQQQQPQRPAAGLPQALLGVLPK